MEKQDLNLASVATRHRNLWELPKNYRCVVIGTCLTLSDIRTLANDLQSGAQDKTDEDLYQFFTEQAGIAEGSIALRTQEFLDKKFQPKPDSARITDDVADDEASLLNLWQTYCDSDRTPLGVWSIFTHPRCTETVMSVIAGDGHTFTRSPAEDNYRKAAQQEAEQTPAMRHEIDVLRNKLAAQKLASARKLKAFRYEVVRLENANQQLSRQLTSATPPAQHAEDLLSKQDSDRIKCLVKETNQLLRTTRAQLQATQSLADDRQKQLEEQKHDITRLEQLVAYLVEQSDADSHTEVDSNGDAGASSAQCSHSLSGKCVLLLGGRPSQCRHLKAFVESIDGNFLHHHGDSDSSYSQIDSLVKQADAVFCPVEQVSHNAMTRAQKLCSKSETPLVFLPKSSLSAFVSGIRTIQ